MQEIGFRYGHLTVKTQQGEFYLDDGSPVDAKDWRPCKACGKRCEPGDDETPQGQDPCIAGLPQTSSACCGHGLDCIPGGEYPAGWVCLNDGRVLEFSGTCGGSRIRQAVEAALNDKPLPEGFRYREIA